jgi:hypothetical protein
MVDILLHKDSVKRVTARANVAGRLCEHSVKTATLVL